MESTEMLDAAGRGDLRRLEILLNAGSDPDIAHPQYGNTALSRACFTDRVEVVRLLLRYGAEPNVRLTYHSPVDGRTDAGVVALMCARSLEVVSTLLQAGADPNVRDADGTTVLMRAALAAPPAVTEALLSAGADPSVRNENGDTAATLVSKRVAWLNTTQSRDTSGAGGRIAELEDIYALLTRTRQRRSPWCG